jgi:hypothetical protein
MWTWNGPHHAEADAAAVNAEKTTSTVAMHRHSGDRFRSILYFDRVVRL